MKPKNICRETALSILAVEIDMALRFGPVTHIKHRAIKNGEHG